MNKQNRNIFIDKENKLLFIRGELANRMDEMD